MHLANEILYLWILDGSGEPQGGKDWKERRVTTSTYFFPWSVTLGIAQATTVAVEKSGWKVKDHSDAMALARRGGPPLAMTTLAFLVRSKLLPKCSSSNANHVYSRWSLDYHCSCRGRRSKGLTAPSHAC